MEDFDEICMGTWQVMQILAKSYGHGACSSLQRLHIKRVMADSFRLKRGRIQASGAENASGFRISMRSARIHGGSLQILAKPAGIDAFSSPCRLHIRRVTAVVRLKRGLIQASGAENGSELI